jgi:hypothetical protein
LEKTDSQVHGAQRLGYFGNGKRRQEPGERTADQSKRIARDVGRYGKLEQDHPTSPRPERTRSS